jgi:methyl-accepting chemotaxis protein
MNSSHPRTGKRKWRNFLLVPRVQLNAVMAIFLTGFIAVSAFFAYIIWKTTEVIYRLAELSETSFEILDVIPRTMQMLWTSYFLTLLIFSACAFIIGILITHRFLGPTVAIRAHIRRLINGDLEKNLTLRKDDALQELADDINELTQKLRGGPEPSRPDDTTQAKDSAE